MPGGPVGADGLVVVSHLSPQSPGREGRPVYLGYLFVEPRRHAAGLADLTEPEAQAVGVWCARASRARRDVAGADRVYAAVLGSRAPHLHVHLVASVPRHAAGVSGAECRRMARRRTWHRLAGR